MKNIFNKIPTIHIKDMARSITESVDDTDMLSHFHSDEFEDEIVSAVLAELDLPESSDSTPTTKGAITKLSGAKESYWESSLLRKATRAAQLGEVQEKQLEEVTT